MKKWIRFELVMILFAISITFLEGCSEKNTSNSKELAVNSETTKASESSVEKEPKKPLTEEFKKYWYAGDAEITSYELKQERYGEIRNGTSVLIYVTEPFLPKEQVKANESNDSNIPVLKVNATKKYLTGIYPYSIMSSTFYPVADNQHALKTSLSIQEWCGQVYSQLNNRNDFEVTSHSYFEGEADQNYKLEEKAILENEIWAKIRVDPSVLPIGDIRIIPSLEFFRTGHGEVRSYNAEASIKNSNGITSYVIDYEKNMRKLTINYTTDFPHTIESWTEEFEGRRGTFTSSGTKMKRLKTPYWRQNSNKFLPLRDSLGL